MSSTGFSFGLGYILTFGCKKIGSVIIKKNKTKSETFDLGPNLEKVGVRRVEAPLVWGPKSGGGPKISRVLPSPAPKFALLCCL